MVFLNKILFYRVTIVSTSTWEVLAEMDKPRVCTLQFSPKGTYLMTWETFAGLFITI